LCEREDASEITAHGRPDDVHPLRAKLFDEACKPLHTEATKAHGSNRYGVAEATTRPIRNHQPTA
jgi:hypothetical protein